MERKTSKETSEINGICFLHSKLFSAILMVFYIICFNKILFLPPEKQENAIFKQNFFLMSRWNPALQTTADKEFLYYFLSCDEEKLFLEFKSQLHYRKSWGKMLPYNIFIVPHKRVQHQRKFCYKKFFQFSTFQKMKMEN